MLTSSPTTPVGHGSPVSGSTIWIPPGSGPRAPAGVSSVRVIATPPSVEPKPSMTTQPNLRPKRSMSPGTPSLPYTARSGLSASSGSSGVASTYERGLPT
ncbi:Uncharacterised protein [Mycobacterium tuberculosis]|uniref:Uncharacterized protein n=1 Tax=Mycobacterium tuberculosis TaxID=1773 RepID=A0A0U0S3W0_MYCTX|nr:Uncharacterised protein [Mycobacterium tuberculosis]